MSAEGQFPRWKRRRKIAFPRHSPPTEFYDRFAQRRPRHDTPENRPLIATATDPQRAVHDLLGFPGCAECGRFACLPMEHLTDAGSALLHVVQAAVLHLHPSVVLETGVARRYPSATILSALRENDRGHPWSIYSQLLEAAWDGTPGMAVTDDLRDRWTSVRGSSLRRLPQLLPALDQVNIFVHDSAHSYWVMTGEFEHAWPKMRRCAAAPC
jgi:hypothetical protein